MCSPSLVPLGASATPVVVLQVTKYSAVYGQHAHLLLEALVWLWNTDRHNCAEMHQQELQNYVVMWWALLMPAGLD